ncbi:MAG: CPBP family glutamic-type intramembrane protease [Planctomycetota bacterium]
MRVWPEGARLVHEESIVAACGACRATFRVHENLAGYRMRCPDCGAWITVARPERATGLELLVAQAGRVEALPEPASQAPLAEQPRAASGLIELETASGEVYEGDIPADAPMAPGTLRHVRADVRTRFVSRTILEISLMVAAILAPFVVAAMTLDPSSQAMLAPIASLFGGLGVIAVGLAAPHYTFSGLRAPDRPFLRSFEASAAAGAALALVVGYVQLFGEGKLDDGEIRALTEPLGMAGAYFVIALCPAIFEELAFRGLLQGRLRALFGGNAGLVLTGVAFALAHGASLATPIHFSLGLYLGTLRERTGSLLPGMLFHALYNGGVVTLAVQ